MGLNVNKVILRSHSDDIITESLEGTFQAMKRAKNATNSIFQGGSAEDEAAAKREFDRLAREKAIKEGKKVIDLGEKNTIDLTDSTDIPKAPKEETEEAAKSIGKKALDSIKEHPGVSTGVAAAIAAGLGALALRKKLKKTNSKKG